MTSTRVPKYWLVKEQLRELVDAGDPGTALPTERELAEQLATSRTTVRQAIAELVVEGLLVRTQGSGTYIAEPRLVHIRQLSSFTDDLGPGRVASRVLAVTVEPATGETALRLGVSTVCRVDRVRLVDGTPLAHETARLAGEYPGLAAELDRGARSTPPCATPTASSCRPSRTPCRRSWPTRSPPSCWASRPGTPCCSCTASARPRAAAPSSGRARPTAATASASSHTPGSTDAVSRTIRRGESHDPTPRVGHPGMAGRGIAPRRAGTPSFCSAAETWWSAVRSS